MPTQPPDRPPPRLFRKILRRVLPGGVVGRSIVGDLDQELREMLAAGRSPLRARLWYRWEVVKLASRWSVERVRAGAGRAEAGSPGTREIDGPLEIAEDAPPSRRPTVAGTKGGWAMGWMQDVRYGFRMLVKSPLLTVVAAVSIALGIGASATMFSVYWSFLLSPLPYPDQDELLFVQQPDRESRFDRPVSPGAFLAYVEGATTVESWAGWRTRRGNLTGGEEPIQVGVVEAYPRTLETLGRQPFLGRGFTEDDGRPGAAPVAVLHYDLWSSRFAADPSVVGRTVSIDGNATTIIGVMPRDFDLLSFQAGSTMLFVPESFQRERTAWEDRSLTVVARRGDGVTREAVASEIGGIWSRVQAREGGELEEQVTRVRALRDEIPGESDTALVQVMLAVGLFLLFLAATNVANLLLARAEARQGEVSIRLAMGAGRARVLRQLLTESVILALVGAGLGVLMAVFGVRSLEAAMPAQIPDVMRPALNGTVLLFTGALALATGVFFGLAPALQSLRGDLRAGLGEGSRGGTADRDRKRLRSAFVAGQVAVALAVLTGSAALVSVAEDIVRADGGFRQEGVLTFTTSLPAAAYAEDGDVVRVTRELERSLAGVPGVRGVAIMADLPRGPAVRALEFTLPEDAADPEADERVASLAPVNPAWFRTLDVELRTGRLLSEADGPDASDVAVVNTAFVRRHFPEGRAIGRRLITSEGEEVEVVGVVEDVLHLRVPLGAEFTTVVYRPLAQDPRRAPALAVWGEGDPAALTPAVRQAVWDVDPELPVADVQSLDAFVEGQLAAPRFLGWALALFGFLALVLSAMGIWGVVAHGVERRTREIGIRMALGAQARSLVGLVSRQGLVHTAVGLALGAPLAFLLLRLAGGITAEIDAELGSTGLYVATGAVLIGVAMVASWVPSIRAARVDPREALASE